MLLDDAVHVVIHVCTYDKTVLRLSVHRLGIDVVVLVLVLHQPAFVLELLELACSFLIDTRVVFAGANREIDFRLDDVIERFLVITSLCTSLFRLKDIVRATLHLLHIFLRRPDSLKRFYNSHD